MLGHYSAAFSLDTYTHVTSRMQETVLRCPSRCYPIIFPFGSNWGQTRSRHPQPKSIGRPANVGLPMLFAVQTLVRATGFEPAAPCSQSKCATKLRYARIFNSADPPTVDEQPPHAWQNSIATRYSNTEFCLLQVLNLWCKIDYSKKRPLPVPRRRDWGEPHRINIHIGGMYHGTPRQRKLLSRHRRNRL